MPQSGVYDKATWHSESELYPADLPPEQAFVPVGFFLAWVIERELYDEEFADDWGGELESVRARRMRGPELYALCDGALAEDMLNEEGNAFAEVCFSLEDGTFYQDYAEVLGGSHPSIYHVPDTWENYERLRERLDGRFAAWRRTQR